MPCKVSRTFAKNVSLYLFESVVRFCFVFALALSPFLPREKESNSIHSLRQNELKQENALGMTRVAVHEPTLTGFTRNESERNVLSRAQHRVRHAWRAVSQK